MYEHKGVELKPKVNGKGLKFLQALVIGVICVFFGVLIGAIGINELTNEKINALNQKNVELENDLKNFSIDGALLFNRLYLFYGVSNLNVVEKNNVFNTNYFKLLQKYSSEELNSKIVALEECSNAYLRISVEEKSSDFAVNLREKCNNLIVEIEVLHFELLQERYVVFTEQYWGFKGG